MARITILALAVLALVSLPIASVEADATPRPVRYEKIVDGKKSTYRVEWQRPGVWTQYDEQGRKIRESDERGLRTYPPADAFTNLPASVAQVPLILPVVLNHLPGVDYRTVVPDLCVGLRLTEMRKHPGVQVVEQTGQRTTARATDGGAFYEATFGTDGVAQECVIRLGGPETRVRVLR
jgi:hypothetical protein